MRQSEEEKERWAGRDRPDQWSGLEEGGEWKGGGSLEVGEVFRAGGGRKEVGTEREREKEERGS